MPAEPRLTLDDVLRTVREFCPAPEPRPLFGIRDSSPLYFPSQLPVLVSHHADLDPRPIRYDGWRRFRAWYEAFCRRIGAETPWEHLPTRTEPQVVAMAGVGILMGPATFAKVKSASRELLGEEER